LLIYVKIASLSAASLGFFFLWRRNDYRCELITEICVFLNNSVLATGHNLRWTKSPPNKKRTKSPLNQKQKKSPRTKSPLNKISAKQKAHKISAKPITETISAVKISAEQNLR
jgi:hypothetical protein